MVGAALSCGDRTGQQQLLVSLGQTSRGVGVGGAMTELGLGGAGPSDMCLTNPQRERRWAVRGGWLAGGRNGKQA